MQYWVTSDTHFGHTKIKEYCGRPDDFEQRIINGFKVIKQEDVIFHLGDICWGKDAQVHSWLMPYLKCKKILILGNHDKNSHSWYFGHGWDCVSNGLRLEMFGKKLFLSHEPAGWDGWWEINVHGHMHNTLHRAPICHPDFTRLIALEYTNYQPVLLDKLICQSNKQRIENGNDK